MKLHWRKWVDDQSLSPTFKIWPHKHPKPLMQMLRFSADWKVALRRWQTDQFLVPETGRSVYRLNDTHNILPIIPSVMLSVYIFADTPSESDLATTRASRRELWRTGDGQQNSSSSLSEEQRRHDCADACKWQRNKWAIRIQSTVIHRFTIHTKTRLTSRMGSLQVNAFIGSYRTETNIHTL